MTDEKLKRQLGANIAAYRKRAGLTQLGLAEKLNYSDKAVSKWERGESIPDLPTLVQLAELFDITVNDLLEDPDALPETTGKVEQAMGKMAEKALKRKADKRVILGLSSLITWFVAMLIFVVVSTMDIPNSWIAFIYAIPCDAIVMLSLRSAWHDFRWTQSLVSVIMWGCLLSIFLSLLVFADINVWKIFLLGIPGQIAVFLWFRLFRSVPKEEKHG